VVGIGRSLDKISIAPINFYDDISVNNIEIFNVRSEIRNQMG